MHGVVRATLETFLPPEPILEVGSYQLPGQEPWSDLRKLVPGKQYIGIDARSGPGVDLVENVEELPRPDASVGTALALNVFEHCPRFWKGFDELKRVLRPDGLLVVSCPFYFHIHNHPQDYWRFTPQAFEFLLQEFPQTIIGYQGTPKRPLRVWAVAAGADYPTFTLEQYRDYQKRLQDYAKQPLPWKKKLSYRLGKLICGGGLVGPYLQTERFETTLRAAA